MKSFSKIYKEDLDIVGKKAVELGELTRLGIPIPDGFVITTVFFKKFLQETGIAEKIKEIQKLNHPAIAESIDKLFEPIKKQIIHTHIPESLALQLHKFYKKLAGLFKEQPLNIFSSSPSNNKIIIFKNIKGDANLVLKIKEIWSSQIHNPIAIIVQKSIRSKNKKTMFTNDTATKDENLLKLAKKIQNYFYFPQEIEYVIEKGKIFVTSIKLFTGIVKELQKKEKEMKNFRKAIIKGVSINPGIVTGAVKLINSHNLNVKNSEIAVTKYLNKSLCNKIKKAKAVITDAVLQTPINKLHYRKMIKAPTIMGTVNATKLLQNGNIITVNGATGEIYSGGFI